MTLLELLCCQIDSNAKTKPSIQSRAQNISPSLNYLRVIRLMSASVTLLCYVSAA